MEELLLRMERAHEAMLRRHERGEDVSEAGRNFTRKLLKDAANKEAQCT